MIKIENPHLWAVGGLCEQFMHFITDRRAGQIGPAPLVGETESPFPWKARPWT